MDADDQKIPDLLDKYFAKTLTASENDELTNWLSQSSSREKFLDLLTPHFFDIATVGEINVSEAEIILENILKSDTLSTAPEPAKIIKYSRSWMKYAAAILVLMIAGTFYYYYNHPDSKNIPDTVQKTNNEQILPGTQMAVLTLSDGKTINLNSDTIHAINEGSLEILNKNGSVNYSQKGSGKFSDKTQVLNTMSTPRGGQYKLTLSDGTNVWLNAESSITYPARFSATERRVTVQGEAYFEVAKDPSSPFIINTNKENISVLGTSFNIRAYANETSKISLAEGSIKVGNKILKKGEAIKGGIVALTNIQDDIAWKNNLFVFHDNESIEEVLRPIARWYNVDIKYEGKVNIHFWGSIGRNLQLKQVLRILQNTEEIKFEINDRTIIVKP